MKRSKGIVPNRGDHTLMENPMSHCGGQSRCSSSLYKDKTFKGIVYSFSLSNSIDIPMLALYLYMTIVPAENILSVFVSSNTRTSTIIATPGVLPTYWGDSFHLLE